MRPIIGITTNLSEDESSMQLSRSYAKALLRHGALPVLLPAVTDPDTIDHYAAMVDGLLLAGGGDVDPLRFGEAQKWESGAISVLRDEFELQLFHAVLRTGRKPILGVCRGLQVMNIALGGSLYQDLLSELPGQTIAHRQHQRTVYCSHPVTVSAGTRLSAIVNAETVMVNSHHHQALKRLSDEMIASAHAPDGLIEAAELPGHPFCIGVQWHPEQLWAQPDGEAHRQLFEAFVTACCQTD